MLGRYGRCYHYGRQRRHWAAADGLSASAANSPELRRTLRKPFAIRDRQQLLRPMYLADAGQRLCCNRTSIADADCGCIRKRFVEQEFFAWADAVGLAEKLRTMRLARVFQMVNHLGC